MCARITQGGKHASVDGKIIVGSGCDARPLKWVGFAREETLDNWLKVWDNDTAELDDFAERHFASGRLVWNRSTAVVKVVVFSGQARIVTREATLDEREKFGHSRVPVHGGQYVQCRKEGNEADHDWR